MNTKWGLYKLRNLTVFVGLFENVVKRCKDAFLPKHLHKNHTMNCFEFEENERQPDNVNLCHFGALALHFYGNHKLEEETSKIFKLFMNRMDGLSTNYFQGVHMNNFPHVEDV